MNKLLKLIIKHFRSFFLIWIVFGLLGLAAWFSSQNDWESFKICGYVVAVLVFVMFVSWPMNAVFGLMGTTGNIRLFFFNFILISTIFAGIYYFCFFKNTGISYDVNQPHIEFSAFNTYQQETFSIKTEKKIFIYNNDVKDSNTFLLETEEVNYQRINLPSVISNTLMTSLMQEPTELFSAAATYNKIQDNANRSSEAIVPSGITLSCYNIEKAQAFHLILIFHIMISWIFFGVFISLLYNKFRYES